MNEHFIFIPLENAVEVANCQGLTQDLIKQLAVRHKVLTWGDMPGRGFVIEQQNLLKIATALRDVRSKSVDQYVSAYDAEQRYGIHRSTWGRWKERGFIRSHGEQLYLEDVAFVAKLAEWTGYTRGRPLFPASYNPY